MDEKDLYRTLETAFVSTFLKELIPGIIHNFANPLNGIMGRGQIMRRRFDQLSAKLEQSYPQAVIIQEELFGKLSKDIDEINRECDRFFNMFQDVSGKFYSLEIHDSGKFSLHELLLMEMRFADYYLAFKHQVKKDIQLDENIPPVTGNYAYCALCVWAILRQAMQDMKDINDKSLLVEAKGLDDAAVMGFEYPVLSMPDEAKKDMVGTSTSWSFPAFHGQEGLLNLADALLKTMGSKIEVEDKEGWRRLTARLKY